MRQNDSSIALKFVMSMYQRGLQAALRDLIHPRRTLIIFIFVEVDITCGVTSEELAQTLTYGFSLLLNQR